MVSRSKISIFFDICTLGCKLNQAEQTLIIKNLTDAGYIYKPSCPNPDFFILNSCTVTNRARYKSLSTLRKIRSKSPSTKLVLAGCIPQTEPDIGEIEYIDLTIDNEEKRNIAEHINKFMLKPEKPLKEESNYNERSRANLIIQTGCDSECSYCIIPRARGTSVSFPRKEILSSLEMLLNEGYREIVLTGIHISHFRSDKKYERRIAPLEELLKNMLKSSDGFRIRLSSIEPGDIDDEFINYILSEDRICNFLHIPLQHTSDRILKLMKRDYTNEYIYRLIESIRSRSGDIQIGSDFIVGFPSESEEDFANILETVRNLPISHLHIFPFSKRKGTPAYTMPGQIPKDEKKQRSSLLRKLGELKKEAFLQTQLNKSQNLAVLGKNPDGYDVLSGNYIPGILITDKKLKPCSLTDGVMASFQQGRAVFYKTR